MAITPLPPAPQITDDPATFNTKANAFVGALPTFVTETNAVATQVDADAASAAIDADDAQAASLAAVAAANYKGEWSSLTGALNIPASVSHNGAVWVLTQNLADVTTDEPGVGSPSVWLIVTLPAQAGNAGKFLKTDGEKFDWQILFPIGALQYFSGATTTTYPGEEWLRCDGSILTQTAYPTLFSTIGLISENPGVAWSTRSSGTSKSIDALAYGNNIFVYAGGFFSSDLEVVATSTDAITWTIRSQNTRNGISALTYGGGIFIVGGLNGELYTSTNGITWTSRNLGTTNTVRSLIYGSGNFIVSAGSGIIRTSTDGITWTARTSNTSSIINDFAYAGDRTFYYVTNGGGLGKSINNGETWTTLSSGTSSNIYAIVYGEGQLVCAGDGGRIATSEDGTIWVTRTSGTTSTIRGLTYGNGVYVYAGAGGVLRTSTDAVIWTSRTSGTSSELLSLTYGDEKFVYSGTGGVLGSTSTYTYNSSIEFALPIEEVKIANGTTNLFIKAE